jgi:hypothetical protein
MMIGLDDVPQCALLCARWQWVLNLQQQQCIVEGVAAVMALLQRCRRASACLASCCCLLWQHACNIGILASSCIAAWTSAHD